MTNIDSIDPPSAKTTKTFVVRRTVVLHDVQEFIVANAYDEFEAQDRAENLIASFSSQVRSPPVGVNQIRCETIDIGESATWSVVVK